VQKNLTGREPLHAEPMFREIATADWFVGVNGSGANQQFDMPAMGFRPIDDPVFMERDTLFEERCLDNRCGIEYQSNNSAARRGTGNSNSNME